MSFPRWATTAHPIYRREAALWRRRSGRWQWLFLPFLFLPLCCAAVCGLSLLPVALEDNSAGALAAVGGVTLIVGLWSLHGFAAWGISLITTIAASTVIARERETLNWPLLRLTTLKPQEIVLAKIAALLTWLRWPIAALLLARLAAVAATALGAAALVLVAPAINPDVTASAQVALWMLTASGAAFLAAFLVVELAASIIYNCAIGLLASAYSRSSASAVALTFVLNLVLALFVFAPAQQAITIGLAAFSNVSLPLSSFVFPVSAGLAGFFLPLFLESAIAAVALILVADQTKRLVE
ncbi:MAG: hypothetical protein AAB427_06500 [Chloroflexota bacterium]